MPFPLPPSSAPLLPSAFMRTFPDALGYYSALRDETGAIYDFRIDYVNAAACAGSPMTPEEQIGERLCEIYPEYRQTDLFSAFLQVVETGIPLETTDLPGRLSVRAWKAEDGFGAIWRLRPFPFSETASERLHGVIDSLAAFVGILSPEGILLEANRTALEAAGLTPDDVLGKPFEDAYWWSYDPAIRIRLRESIHRAAAGEAVRYDVSVRVAEGRLIRIDFSLVPRKDAQGKVLYLVPSAVDVTERECVLQRLRDSEEQFRATFDQAAVGIAHVGLDGTWLRVNQALCSIIGYTREELFAATFQDITHPDDLHSDLRHFEQLKSGDLKTYSLEKRYFRKTGEIVWINLTVSLVRDADPPYCISVIEDITARKRQEEEITDLNTRLQRAMAETHHRVKNNLQVISALVEISVGDAVETVPLASVSRIGQHVRTLAELHDLLTQQAHIGESTDTVSARATLERLARFLRATTGDRPVLLEADDVRISVRAGASLAILVNEMVANAVKHGSGPIRLDFRVQEEKGVEKGAELEVRDDGPGFPPDFAPEISANTGLMLIESAGQYDLRGNVLFRNRPEGGASVLVRFSLPV